MRPLRPGQAFKVERVEIVASDGNGNAHAFLFAPASINWELSHVARIGDQPTCVMTIAGPMKRRTKQIPPSQGEIE